MKNPTSALSVLLLLSGIHSAFTFQTLASNSATAASRLWSAPAIEETSSSTNEGKEATLLSRDRYIATNRFTVRPNSQAKFEKRWADRSSRLASLEGFRYFHLMRRVALDNDVDSGIDPLANIDEFGNYVSFTIWQEKKHFNAWRAGDAFKEAHGGTSLFAFVTTMVSSAMVLKGAPKPAFYDGLLHQSTVPDSVPETVDGWRNVEADGRNILPSECFVACNQFFVPPSKAEEFEQRWAGRTSKLKECEGFVSFDLLRRDVKAKGHGIAPMGEEEPTYMTCTIWKDRAAFNAWKNGSAFTEAHKEKNEVEEKSKMPLWTKPPVPVFYEGTLVISSPEGA